MVIRLKEYIDSSGKNTFADWVDKLDDQALVRIQTYLGRLEQGNFSNVASVGGGIHELRVHFGPGYRIYFGRVKQTLILLLGGGTKRHQQSDINAAKRAWEDYKHRKSGSKSRT